MNITHVKFEMWIYNERSQREVKLIGKETYIYTINAKGTSWGQSECKEQM